MLLATPLVRPGHCDSGLRDSTTNLSTSKCGRSLVKNFSKDTTSEFTSFFPRHFFFPERQKLQAMHFAFEVSNETRGGIERRSANFKADILTTIPPRESGNKLLYYDVLLLQRRVVP